ncbi:MAG: histidine kinase [Bacteroidia bacterium]|nr:histidine kinase [Bacteroidia bacterium]
MAQTKLKKAVLLIFTTLWLLLLAGTASFWNQYTRLQLLELDAPEHDHFGGNDWVKWEDSPNGIVASQIHPLIDGNSDLRDGYIQKGDLLRKIDYREVFKADMVEDLCLRNPPGRVFIYQLERKDPGAFQAEILTPFIRLGFVPPYTFADSGFLWRIFVWMVALGTFLALVTFLIMAPLTRGKLGENIFLMLTILTGLGLFLFQFIRHVALLLETDLTHLNFEKFFTAGFGLLLVIYSGFYLLARGEKSSRWFTLPSLAIGLALAAQGIAAVYSNQFWIYSRLIITTQIWLFLLHVVTGLALSVAEKWKTRSRMDRTFHILALAGSFPLFLVYTLGTLGLDFLGGPGEIPLFLAHGAIFIPLVNLAAGELKFGKVSVVLTQSILYLLFSLLVVFTYLLLHELLNYAGIVFRYRNLFEIAILVVLGLAGRFIFQRNEGRLRRYFVLTQQERLDRFNEFIQKIPQHTSSEALAQDVELELGKFFGTTLVELILKEDDPAALRAGLDARDLEVVREALENTGGFWARNKQLSEAKLPDSIEEKLSLVQVNLIYLIRVKERLHGWLFLGRRESGVYNLSDLELISRALQQTRLTLDVLDLIEREKLLMEKNYEANLTALRSQINPHFLFNTLNTISSLIHDDPDDAESAIEKLAFIFRYTLKHSAAKKVSLRDEMSLVQTYLDIEQMRFGKRLQVHYELDPEVMEVQFPAFVIQTIVENCIKHGIAKILADGRVTIVAQPKEGFMEVEIEDNGPGIDLAKVHTSTGLNNILTRLQEIYQMENLLYFENTGNGTKVTLKIPLNKPAPQI